jgi:hypothetical protein
MRSPEQIAAEADFGKPSAAKRGRRKEWPYVPVIDTSREQNGFRHTSTQQIKGRAYATREEAIACAARVIEHRRQHLATQLREQGARALRQQYGLPQEVADLTV